MKPFTKFTTAIVLALAPMVFQADSIAGDSSNTAPSTVPLGRGPWMDGSVESCPAPIESVPPTGPSIGIRVRRFHAFDEVSQTPVSGVRVVKDNRKRRLYRRNSLGRTWRYSFRVGHDVILRVNENPVDSADDVLRFTRRGWNGLEIYDRAMDSTATYWIKL